MATNLVSFRPIGVQVYASSGHRKTDLNQRKSATSTNWWSPLFGWSSDPDYIDSSSNSQAVHQEDKPENRSNSDSETKPVRSSRFAPGCFTEEKARQLRMLTTDTGSFHDVMYHSSIASRLASDFKSRSDPSM